MITFIDTKELMYDTVGADYMSKYNRKMFGYIFSESKNQKLSRIGMSTKMGFDKDKFNEIDYPNYFKLRFLSYKLNNLSIYQKQSKEWKLEFINKFYFDEMYNKIFDYFIDNEKHFLLQPSIDHLISRSNGDKSYKTDLNNLHCITFVENLAKNKVNWGEWCKIKEKYGIVFPFTGDSIK